MIDYVNINDFVITELGFSLLITSQSYHQSYHQSRLIFYVFCLCYDHQCFYKYIVLHLSIQ